MHLEHVVHLTPSFGCGGLEKVIANLLHQCSGNENVKHTVVSLSPDTSFAHALPENVEVLTVNKKEGLDVLAHYRVGKLLKNIKCTILHTYNFGALEYHGCAKVSGVKKHIHSDHGLGGDAQNGDNAKHNTFRKLISNVIDEYIVVSDDLKEWVTKTVGVDPKKVKVIHNGVLVPEKGVLNDKSPGSLKLLIVGRLVEVKNHQRLLDALSLTKLQMPELDISCDVVGDGPLLEMLKEKKNPLATFHGLQDNVSEWIVNSDALILSSDYEAMPMTVLEAMSLCRPVICPNVGGVSGFVSEDDIFLIEGKSTSALSEEITKLALAKSGDYEDKVMAAYDKVESLYTVQVMSEQYMALYKTEPKKEKAAKNEDQTSSADSKPSTEQNVEVEQPVESAPEKPNEADKVTEETSEKASSDETLKADSEDVNKK